MNSGAYRPYAFLAALDGSRADDREIIRETRDEEVKITGHMLLGSKIATIYAFSGNGKTSLIGAGLVPFFLDLGYSVFKTRPRPPYALSDPVQAFKEGCIRDNWVPCAASSDTALVADARQQLEDLSPELLPGVRRLVQLVEAQLTRLSASPESRSADLSAHLRRIIDAPLPAFLASAQRFLGLNTPVVVICDQFEEIFVHYYNTPAFDDFVEALKETCDQPDIRVHFLFSMREDWVGSMIAFRRAIPDILNSTFRLDPIRRSRAAPALAIPAARAGYILEEDTAKLILADLCRYYEQQQQKGLFAVRLTRSPADDPFIELPALQAVGDRLWDTRDGGARYRPFTLEHYRAMVSEEDVRESGSPAAAVLDHYLANTLHGIDDGKGGPDPALDEVRLDVLYLLTDKTAYRRGLGEKELLAEIRKVRPPGLNLPGVDLDLLRKAITPLRQRWLIREELAADKEVRYELAHDFVVRSVLRAWAELDRRRIRELAILSRKRDEVERKVADLSRMERTGLLIIVSVTPIMIAVLGWLMTLAANDTVNIRIPWLLSLAVFVLLTAGLISRLRLAVVVAAVTLLLFFVGVYFLGFRFYSYSPYASQAAPYVRINAIGGAIAFGLGFFLVAGYAGILAAFARRWPLSEASQGGMQLLWAELIDIVVALAFGFLSLGVVLGPLSNIEIVPDNLWLATFIVSVWGLYTVGSAVMLRIQRRTIGYLIAGITDAWLPHTTGPILLRQAIFGIWSLLNLPWLLPAMFLRLLRLLWGPATPRPFYDRWTASPEPLPPEDAK